MQPDNSNIEIYFLPFSPIRQGYDIDRDCVFQDLLRPAGFFRAIGDVLRLKRSGLLFAGLPCGSFIYLSQGTHRRHSTRWGQEQYKFVADGNVLGSRFAFLAALGTVRQAVWAIENPLRTHLFWLPPLHWLLHLPIGAIAVRWCLDFCISKNVWAFNC